jgi:hypothetical protein
MSKSQVYIDARAASERIKIDLQAAAESAFKSAIDIAHAEFTSTKFKHAGTLQQLDAASGRAGDLRQAAYDLAERMHQARLACLAQHFGEHYRGPGDPDAEHAQQWLAEHVDPQGLFAPPPAEPALSVESLTYNGIPAHRPVIVTPLGERRVGGNTAIAPGSDPPRGSFVPVNADAFMAAKRAGIFGNAAEVVPETMASATDEATLARLKPR